MRQKLIHSVGELYCSVLSDFHIQQIHTLAIRSA